MNISPDILKRIRVDNPVLPACRILKITAFFICMQCQSITLFSQSISISCKGKDVTNREVTAEGNATDDELKVFLVIANASDKAIQVKVRKTECSVIQGSLNSFCLGVCYAPFVTESAYPFSIAAGKSTSDSVFSLFYCPNGFAGKSVIKYDLFDISDPANNRASVTANFIGYSSGTRIESDITCIETIQVYPNPCSGDRIIFKLPGAGKVYNGRIMVLNCAGNTVASFSMTDCTGNFSTAVGDYPGGIYSYSLIINKKHLFSGKFIIEH